MSSGLSCPKHTSLWSADMIPPFQTHETKEWQGFWLRGWLGMQTTEQAGVDISTMTGEVRSPTRPCSSQTPVPCTGPQRGFLSTPHGCTQERLLQGRQTREFRPVHRNASPSSFSYCSSSSTTMSGSHERQEAFLALISLLDPRDA